MKIRYLFFSLAFAIFLTNFSLAEDVETMPSEIPANAKSRTSNLSEKNSKISGKTSKIDPRITGIKLNSSQVKKQVNEIAKKDSNIKLIESDNKLRVILPSDILFDFDKYEIKSEALQTLRHVADILSKFQNSKTILEGHTDSVGDDDYNYNLSVKRANSVRNWFANNANISPANLESVGLGETQPVAENTLPNGKDNPEGRKKNRRAEIVINKTK